MPTDDGQGLAMTLNARSAAFAAVLASAQATDGAGQRIDTEEAVLQILQQFVDLRHRGGTVYFAGNGGSAAIASHAVTDFLNVGRLRSMSIHDASLLTCMANDYGYEHAFARILSVLVRPGDLVVAISSSGRSANICNASRTVRGRGGQVLTLSGFLPDNPLRSLGDFNIWLNSNDYGMVEIGHQFVLHNLSDRLRT